MHGSNQIQDHCLISAPCETRNTSSTLSVLDPVIRQRCKDLGILSLPRAQMEEEQEHEVNREQEREREVELPPKAEPAEHFLHQDVVAFVKTGIIPPLQLWQCISSGVHNARKELCSYSRSGCLEPIYPGDGGLLQDDQA